MYADDLGAFAKTLMLNHSVCSCGSPAPFFQRSVLAILKVATAVPPRVYFISCPQIPAVQPQKIERVIARLAAAGHELVEVRAAVGVQYHTLTIQNGALSFQTAQGLLEQRIKLMEFLPLARHQLRLVAVDVQHAAKAVVLQLVDPVGMADRLLYRR